MAVSTDQSSSLRAPEQSPGASTTVAPDLAKSAAGVSLRSVTKKYGAVTAIKDINLEIPAGVYCCLLGPSGCGKTTALRVISGHETVTSGQVLIGDHQVHDLPPAKRNTAMMFQNYALFPHKTVWQNIEFGLKMKQVPLKERQQRVDEILDLVGLSHTGDRKPHQLSGGQQQRIALARALVNRPQVLMLDEPLSALDENLRVRMRGELRKIQKQFGLTFIQVTHHVEEAFSLSDQIVVMNHGHIDQIATPGELFATPASQFVAKFIGDNNLFSGKVVSTTAYRGNRELVELTIPGLGNLFAIGHGGQVGTEAACSVRPDLLQLETTPAAPQPAQDKPANALTARITNIELTGFVTRVSLAIEATGQDLLHTIRTVDCSRLALQEGQLVSLKWSVDDCVFLPY
ncbi:MAG: ABC transporter ATP-binding protein [Leptolyngbya sp. RL_3_1]|nr:ABC transporter ATP-binding protein [Leptolyngbya sp. RL_3_1]